MRANIASAVWSQYRPPQVKKQSMALPTAEKLLPRLHVPDLSFGTGSSTGSRRTDHLHLRQFSSWHVNSSDSLYFLPVWCERAAMRVLKNLRQLGMWLLTLLGSMEI